MNSDVSKITAYPPSFSKEQNAYGRESGGKLLVLKATLLLQEFSSDQDLLRREVVQLSPHSCLESNPLLQTENSFEISIESSPSLSQQPSDRPLHIYLIETVQQLWLRVKRLFYDFWY